MKTSLLLFSLLSLSAYAQEDLINRNCIQPKNITATPGKVIDAEKKLVQCHFGYNPVVYYELWRKADPELTLNKIKALSPKYLRKLKPDFTQDYSYKTYITQFFIASMKKGDPKYKDCKPGTISFDQKFELKCGEETLDLSSEYKKFINEDENVSKIFQHAYVEGSKVADKEGVTSQEKEKVDVAETQKVEVAEKNVQQEEKSDTKIEARFKKPLMLEPLMLEPLAGKEIKLLSAPTSYAWDWKTFQSPLPFTFPKRDPVFFINTNTEPVKTDNTVIVPVDGKDEVLVEDLNGDGVVDQEEAEKQMGQIGQTEPDKEEVPKEEPKEEPKVEAASLDECKEALQQALAEILKDDTKNVIGMQYELTVLKMAVLASESKGKTMESFIQSQSKAIQEADKEGKILNKVNETYKKYGLPEDQKALVDHLKQKATAAEYYKKEKRFYNEESSAFLLAYQNLNPEAGFKDSDISILWYMEKVNQRAILNSKGNKFTAQSNLTNLSTRVARYTADIKGLKSQSKESLLSLVNQQKKKIDKEMEAVLEGFKQSNLACYNSLFGGAAEDKDCNLKVLDEEFSRLLSIVSQIPSSELISLDDSLKGNFTVSHKNKELITKFKIERVIKEEERAPAGN